jgi:hypothetical protein
MPEPHQESETGLTPRQRKAIERCLEERYLSRSETDPTPEEREKLLQQFEDLGKGFQEIGDEFGAKTEEQVRQLAGPHLSVMLHSSEDAEKYLESSEPSLRQAAIHLLYHYWGQRDAYADRYEQIAMSDSDDNVRSRALGLLGSCYCYSRDRRISRMLANVVLDRKEADNIRLGAYAALLCSQGYPTEAGTMFPVSFPDDVNWTFVESCLLRST